jgi:hypothetical protein
VAWAPARAVCRRHGPLRRQGDSSKRHDLGCSSHANGDGRPFEVDAVRFLGSTKRQRFGDRSPRLLRCYIREAAAVQTNVQLQNGLTYAGILTPSGPTPANTHVDLHGRTLRADFELDPSFPLLRPVQLKRLSWVVSFSGTDLRTLRLATPRPLNSHDQLPDNPYLSANSISPEIRQSDGKKITPR